MEYISVPSFLGSIKEPVPASLSDSVINKKELVDLKNIECTEIKEKDDIGEQNMSKSASNPILQQKKATSYLHVMFKIK